MDNEKSLKSKENKKLEKSNSHQKTMNKRNIRKLNINLSSYYKLTKNNDNTIVKKNISLYKSNKPNSTEIKDNQKRDSILFKKFLEFKNNNRSKKKLNKSNSKSKTKNNIFKSSKSSSSFSTTNLKDTKNKAKSESIQNTQNSNKSNKKTKKTKNFNKKKKTQKIINKTELFNNIINNNSKRSEKKDDKKCNNLKRVNSCQNFSNNNNYIKDFEIKDKTNKCEDKQDEKPIKMKRHMSLNLISQKYFEKMKFNKYKFKYYNKKNNDYANERRQRVEEKVNEILYEKYKIIRPLRMTKRKFYIENGSKYDKNNNQNVFDNNMCKILKKNTINSMYFYLNNYKDNIIENQKEENIQNYNQIIYYNNKINDIIKMRKYLSIEDFFGSFRRDYNLLDFNFTFLYHHFKK